MHYVEGWRLYHSTGDAFRDGDEITDVMTRTPAWLGSCGTNGACHGVPRAGQAGAASGANPGQRLPFYAVLTVVDGHSSGIFRVILLSLPSFSAEMTARPRAAAGAVTGAPTDEGHHRLARFWLRALPPIMRGTAPGHNVPAHARALAAAAAVPAAPTEQGQADAEVEIAWAPVDGKTLHVSGKGFDETAALFSRLPLSAARVVQPPAVWGYSFDSAGLYTVFETAPAVQSIYLRWTKGCS